MFQMLFVKQKQFSVATVEGGKATSTKYFVSPPKGAVTTVSKIKFYLFVDVAKQCCLSLESHLGEFFNLFC